MMLLKVHTLVSLAAFLEAGRTIKEWEQMIPYILLPDSIRVFNFGFMTNSRVLTHFEINPKTGIASGIKFPTEEELKTLNIEKIQHLSKTIGGNYDHQVVMGDEISLDYFSQMNPTSSMVTEGCLMHLLQDIAYDSYVNRNIDCGNRYCKESLYMGKIYSPDEIKALLRNSEEYGFRLLQRQLSDEFGVVVDERFFEEHVKRAIDSAYCDKMAKISWEHNIIAQHKELPEYSKSARDVILRGIEEVKQSIIGIV